MNRIGLLCSGGDAPGMNAAVRAVVRAAGRRGLRVLGFQDGFCGLHTGAARLLLHADVAQVIHRGGTILGTSRCPHFFDADIRAVAALRLRELDIDGLIVIGGDGSFRGALALQDEHRIAIAGIPGTIDNDVWGTAETLGFDTAVNVAMTAIDHVRDTSDATRTLFFVEVMGRTSGAIAMHTGLATGALDVLVPEASEDESGITERLRVSVSSGQRSHIIVVAEGEEPGGAFSVARRIGEACGCDYRVLVLGHLQRGGPPTARDRFIGSVSGALAIAALADGRSGVMIGMQGGVPIEVPLVDVVKNRQAAPDIGVLQLSRELAG